jgi:hypothetical protein
LLGLLELLGFIEFTLVRGWRSASLEVGGDKSLLAWWSLALKFSISKVSTRFEKLRPAKIVFGGLLEMLGLLGFIELLGPTLVRGWSLEVRGKELESRGLGIGD